MNSQQQITVEKSLKQLESLNLNEVAKKLYSGQDLRSLAVGDQRLPEFIATFNRVIKQLRAEMDRGNWQLLPYNFNDADMGSGSLAQYLQHMVTYLSGSYTFDQASSQLQWLVHYQMQFGFWDKSKLRVHSVDELELQKALDSVELLKAEVERRVGEVETLKDTLQRSQEELDEYRTQKQQEFKTITSNQQQSSELLKEIRDFQTEASTSNATITTLAEQQKQVLTDSRERNTEERKSFADFSKSFDELHNNGQSYVKELDKKELQFTHVLADAKEKEQHILNSKERIEKLLGFAADGALGHTFNRRREELIWPVRLWGMVAITAAGFALWWVLHIFELYPSHGTEGFSWSVTLLNVVRTSPAFFLLYFAIAQYTKERNLQEEYAFKGAVAMTVTAYSDMIGSEAEKTAMLVSAIQGIYTPPSLGKESTPMIFSTKHLADATKNIVDTATALKTTATDLVTAARA